MHKTQISRSISRAYHQRYMADAVSPAYEFGDEDDIFSGKCNMPIVAIAGIAGGIATIASATVTALQIVSAVGAIASGIGMLTGNEKLAKIGGVISMVGGIGSFAASQGWIGGAEAVKSATEVAASGATQGAQAANVTQAAGGNLADVAKGGADIGGQIESATMSAVPQPVVEVAQGGLMNPNSAQVVENAGAIGGAPTPTVAAVATTPIADAAKTQVGVQAVKTGAEQTGGVLGGFLDSFKAAGKFMEENKQMTSLAGSFIGGMFDKEKEAKEKLLQAQTDMLRQEKNNMSNTPSVTAGKRPSVFRSSQQTYKPVGLMTPTR